jgi:hypothetical protein
MRFRKSSTKFPKSADFATIWRILADSATIWRILADSATIIFGFCNDLQRLFSDSATICNDLQRFGGFCNDLADFGGFCNEWMIAFAFWRTLLNFLAAAARFDRYPAFVEDVLGTADVRRICPILWDVATAKR